MQSIISEVQRALGGNAGLMIGLFIVVALSLQVALAAFGLLRRLGLQFEARRLSNDLLRARIEVEKRKIGRVEQEQAVWNGFRKFRVDRKVLECKDVFSFYLKPHDGKLLPSFKPGQYLTFQLKSLPGANKPVIRCYSLSDSPDKSDYYRVTIKKAQPPPGTTAPTGLASSFFCDVLKEGDILDVKAPNGHFFLDPADEKPVVLIGGGVGLTPVLSMLNWIVASGSKREVWLFFGARNRSDHIQKEYLESVAKKHEHLRLHVCYSRPDTGDEHEHDYHHQGHVDMALLKKLLPSNNYDFFICGPGPMLKSMREGLREWGVPDQNVFFEAFGGASIPAAPAAPASAPAAASIKIEFTRSGQKFDWDPKAGNLLDFAQSRGIKIESGCCAGNCGTCLVAIKAGKVDYLSEPGDKPEEGSCLTCVCTPGSDLVLDA